MPTKRAVVSLIILAALVFVLSAAVRAQSAASPTPAPAASPTTTPASIQIQGVTVTMADIAQLVAAVHQALQPNEMTVPIIIEAKSSTEMPSYDPVAHYVGIQDQAGKKVMVVWLNSTDKADTFRDAKAGAFALAITDGGYAGPAFKQLYDVYAEQDAKLPANAPDPYLNRHRFASALVHVINYQSARPSP
jgi:hypothetical protein